MNWSVFFRALGFLLIGFGMFVGMLHVVARWKWTAMIFIPLLIIGTAVVFGLTTHTGAHP